MLTQRIIRLNDKVRNTDPTIDLDRARLITEFYSRPSMDNYILEKGKGFSLFLRKQEDFYRPGFTDRRPCGRPHSGSATASGCDKVVIRRF